MAMRHNRLFKFMLSILTITVLSSIFIMRPSLISAQSPNTSSKVSAQQTFTWLVHLYAIPSSDGTGLFAFTGQTGNFCKNGNVTFNAILLAAPTPFDGAYDAGEQIYSGFLDSFFPAPADPDNPGIAVAKLNVECDLLNGNKLKSPDMIFKRYYFPNDGTEVDMPANDDNSVILTLFPTSLNTARYVIVMETNGLPGSFPAGTGLLSKPYSFRAHGALPSSSSNMDLVFKLTNIGGIDPLTVHIEEWNASDDRWQAQDNDDLLTGGDLRLSKLATSFTTFVLVETPRWHDNFSSDLGIEGKTNMSHIPLTKKIELESSASNGTLTSNPYSPTMQIQAWHSISYTANITAGTSMTINVLSQNGQLLASNVNSGFSLSSIDPIVYPSLKLQVEMSTQSPGTSPELHAWTILATPKSPQVFLPVIIKPS